ncbi:MULTISPECIES: TetR/AcrR family transcriptional regulator [unclassified Microbacterium]|uniref:TetR/AcrR family transcriptional regulator n=1 Tax=unclassified Microbacterium TaxID=2609290 RepID=UPI0012F9BDA6|nr:TetR/AcrR family transcriptional regulator [Microbacterium sp. MAH-37]MVQ42874.1 TetR family transcriptional regulator [Microbacterium sp. MAH-37]
MMSNTTDAGPPRRRGRPGGLDGADLLSAAREVFLDEGFAAATMDAVAASARISKQTLYRRFASKEELFAAVVADWVERGRDAMRPHLDRLRTAPDVRAGLRELADVLHAGVLSTPVVRMRGLVIAEAERLPDVAADYVRLSWERNQALLADALAELGLRGSLKIADAATAAQQFTWLVLAAPLDRITLTGGAERPTAAGLTAIADDAVETFLARYAP